MILPTNDTIEVLRIERRTVSFDTTFILAFGEWSVFGAEPADTTLAFTWVSNENGWDLPVATAEIEIDTAGNQIATIVEWLMAPNPKPVPPPPTSTKDIAFQQFEVFPNPTSEHLNVQFERPFKGTLEVVDFNGKIVNREAVDGASTWVDLKSNISGNYVLILKNEEGRLAGFRQFILQQ